MTVLNGYGMHVESLDVRMPVRTYAMPQPPRSPYLAKRGRGGRRKRRSARGRALAQDLKNRRRWKAQSSIWKKLLPRLR